jgi:hypothetical protein
MRKAWLLAAVAMLPACTDEKSPLAPTTIAAPAPPLVAPPLPTSVPGVLAVAMPIDTGDPANVAFGLAPFGYHDAFHAEDGHTGWDIEYRIGGIVRAAAAGTVLSVSADPAVGGRSIVQIEHLVGTHYYRTIYTNLADVRDTVVTDAAVVGGQPIGTAGTVSQVVGRIPLVYAMTHFQLDDLEFHREGPDPKSVSPEPFLNSQGRSVFDRVWAGAAFPQELVEPFATNPRTLAFPASRTWTRAGGDGPAGIRFSRRSRLDPTYEYALLAESGTAIETGTVSFNAAARPFPTIDLFSATAIRLGTYDIVANEMRLSLANPGSNRPADVGAASVYRTTR